MIKAIAGGGGRGMRRVDGIAELDSAYERCRSEAMQAFGNGDVYVEKVFPKARHIEVQVIGDGTGEVTHLWERECSLQRNRQKLVEIAPAPGLPAALRDSLIDAALRMARAVKLRSLATFEFLVAQEAKEHSDFAFIEANPRLQVEHTVTEEVLGVDLVKAQLAVAAGATLASLGLAQTAVPAPRGYAMQLRINMEVMDEKGTTKPTGGTLAAFDPPSGPGVRVDSFGYCGYKTSAAFDSLLAKVIVHSPTANWADVVHKAARSLREFRIQGVATNIAFIRAVLAHPDFIANRLATDFIDTHVATLVSAAGDIGRPLFFASEDAGAEGVPNPPAPLNRSAARRDQCR